MKVKIVKPNFVPDCCKDVWLAAARRLAKGKQLLTKNNKIAYPKVVDVYDRILGSYQKLASEVAGTPTKDPEGVNKQRKASVKVYRALHVPEALGDVWHGAAENLVKKGKLLKAGKVNYELVNEAYHQILGYYRRLARRSTQQSFFREALKGKCECTDKNCPAHYGDSECNQKAFKMISGKPLCRACCGRHARKRMAMNVEQIYQEPPPSGEWQGEGSEKRWYSMPLKLRRIQWIMYLNDMELDEATDHKVWEYQMNHSKPILPEGDIGLSELG